MKMPASTVTRAFLILPIIFVIPAKAGIQLLLVCVSGAKKQLDSRFRGNDGE
ncbi:hypothetical protein [Stakelama tenebrarum]|uniref:Uncharacterized protein n=1 Tax=Stakelama tenebrarum TaxID=2711215 RepID=A0A6G6Y8E1_9SPHN|nr:hypothetical protein [Sphingosinithalassobacter tenebrarum]QIG81195.1 hypothetical protein G5C33_16370 [Sphingosinithalassobacter tenebrarum]